MIQGVTKNLKCNQFFLGCTGAPNISQVYMALTLGKKTNKGREEQVLITFLNAEFQKYWSKETYPVS